MYSRLSDIKAYNLVTIDLEGLAQDKSGDMTLPDGKVVGALGGLCYYSNLTDIIIQMDPFNDSELTPRIRVERFAKVFSFLKDILTEPK